jgi:hypothetical protein
MTNNKNLYRSVGWVELFAKPITTSVMGIASLHPSYEAVSI